MQLPVAGFLIVLVAASGARAEDRVVAKPGIMCRSATALAILTLPGGDSRTHRMPANGTDLKLFQEGGCQDLRIGQPLRMVKAFRNTAIVTVDGGPREGPPAVYVAPTIDLVMASASQPEPSPSTSPLRRLERDDPVSEAELSSFAGLDTDAFMRTHPGGECAAPAAGARRCVYHDVRQADCPLALGCSDVIYEFSQGHMTSFQTSLSFEEDWKAAYRLAQGQYPVLKQASTPAGNSTFFRTGHGTLGFGRTFVQAGGIPEVWQIRLIMTTPAEDIR